MGWKYIIALSLLTVRSCIGEKLLICKSQKHSLPAILNILSLSLLSGQVHEWIEVRFTHSEKHVKFVQNIFYENDL